MTGRRFSDKVRWPQSKQCDRVRVFDLRVRGGDLRCADRLKVAAGRHISAFARDFAFQNLFATSTPSRRSLALSSGTVRESRLRHILRASAEYLLVTVNC